MCAAIPSSRMRRSAVVTLVVLLVAQPAAAEAQSFTLTGVTFRPGETPPTLHVRAASLASAPDELSETTRWKISVTRKGQTVVLDNSDPSAASPIVSVSSVPSLSVIRIVLDAQRVPDLSDVSAIAVVFVGRSQILTTSFRASGSGSGGLVAKGKADADLYVAGGFLLARQSAPIIMLDTKVKYGWPSGQDHHWAGVVGTLAINPDARPPAESIDVNPDAIGLFYQMDYARSLPTNGLFYGVEVVANPIGFEFAADPGTGTVVSAGRLRVFSHPFFNALVVDAGAGFELGKNMRKPTTLLGRPVDSGVYNSIARGVFTVDAMYYGFGERVTASHLYRFVLSGSWQGRALGTSEPFVKSRRVLRSDGTSTRAKALEFKGGMRHYVEAAFTWNVTPHFGVAVTHRRGSLPPLFPFVEPQVAVNLTYKTKFGRDFIAAR
jgi:hypothetical protein